VINILAARSAASRFDGTKKLRIVAKTANAYSAVGPRSSSMTSYGAEKLDACSDAVSGGQVERADLDFRVAERHGRLDLARATPVAGAPVDRRRRRGPGRAVVEVESEPAAAGHSRLGDKRDARSLGGVDADDDLRLVGRRRAVSAHDRLSHRHFLYARHSRSIPDYIHRVTDIISFHIYAS